ncbi:hypothetical protein AHF37_00191 [Paragonimus kellicotti]|nr:hypothetical protein AHF37_00191 [Paragonimus kellicotti]
MARSDYSADYFVLRGLIVRPSRLVAPVLLTAKRLLQELCRKKADWDGELASEEIVAWQEWLHGLAGLTELRIPRCIKPRTLEGPYQMELHGFSDASEAGYGAAIYARLVATVDLLTAPWCSGSQEWLLFVL